MQAPVPGSGFSQAPPLAGSPVHPAQGVHGTGGSGVGAALEYVLRLVFFAVAPVGIVVTAALVPMTAALVNMVLALAGFFFGEVLRRHSEQRSWLGRVLRKQLAFEAYYREHPPKPFIYYLFYPLLLPYWLSVREARREFLLFKGYTIATLLVLAFAGAYRLKFVYGPELGLKDFVQPFAIGLVVETVAVLMILMPITTSVVALHQDGRRGRLIALLAVGLVSGGCALGWIAHRHRTFPSLETRYRVGHRSAAKPDRARKAMIDALHAAWRKRREKSWGREDDGMLAGPALDAARESLLEFYKPDEASAFEIWTTAKNDKTPMMVLYAEGPRKGRPEVLAMRGDGTIVDKLADIPKPARKMMRTVGDF